MMTRKRVMILPPLLQVTTTTTMPLIPATVTARPRHQARSARPRMSPLNPQRRPRPRLKSKTLAPRTCLSVT
jgi:hypothetical protein